MGAMADDQDSNRRTRVDGEPDRRGAEPGTFGQAPHVPTEQTREMVKALAACGMPHEAIAATFAPPISADTLKRHYAADLEWALDQANAKVAGTMFKMATNVEHKDCQRAGAFWLQNRAGWATRSESTTNLGLGGGEAPGEGNVKPTKITVEFVDAKTTGLPGGPDAK